jgi:c-di-GMP-binding flagellar brake protein YcgR
MLTEEGRRKYPRTLLSTPVNYCITVLDDAGELKKIHNTGISVDISDGGLGIKTCHPLEEGHVLIFKEKVRINNIAVNASVVKWTKKIRNDKYRVGLEFVKKL